MAQYCELCGKVTNCTEDCRECLKEEELPNEKEEESECKYGRRNSEKM